MFHTPLKPLGNWLPLYMDNSTLSIIEQKCNIYTNIIPSVKGEGLFLKTCLHKINNKLDGELTSTLDFDEAIHLNNSLNFFCFTHCNSIFALLSFNVDIYYDENLNCPL